MSEALKEFERQKKALYNKVHRSNKKRKKVVQKVRLVRNKPSVSTEFERIRDIVCHQMNVTVDQLKEKSRKREWVIARQVIMYFTQGFCSLAYIGKELGNRDHSTVIHGISTIEDLRDSDFKFREDLEELKNIIDGKETVLSPKSAEKLSDEVNEVLDTYQWLKREL